MKCPSLAKPERRYHSISPCLAGKRSAEEQADAIGFPYSTVCRWLRKFREEGMPGLFPVTQYPREPQTPEHVIVTLHFCVLAEARRRSEKNICPAALISLANPPNKELMRFTRLSIESLRG
jgi:hypothetical protein